MSQRQINAAHKRSLTKSYEWFTPAEKRLIKAREQMRRNDKECGSIGRDMVRRYGKGWRRHPWIQDNSDFQLYMRMQIDNIKLSERISRLEEKHDLNRDELMDQFNQLNRGRCYGGSF